MSRVQSDQINFCPHLAIENRIMCVRIKQLEVIKKIKKDGVVHPYNPAMNRAVTCFSGFIDTHCTVSTKAVI